MASALRLTMSGGKVSGIGRRPRHLTPCHKPWKSAAMRRNISFALAIMIAVGLLAGRSDGQAICEDRMTKRLMTKRCSLGAKQALIFLSSIFLSSERNQDEL